MNKVEPEGVPDEYALYERTATTTTVHASIDACFAVGADIAKYPEWVVEIDSATVIETDAQGRVLTAEFKAEAMGRTSQYVLRYDYSQAPTKLAWNQVDGDLTERILGSYEFSEVVADDGSPSTEVTYRLFIELAFPLPGFVKRRAEHKIVESALQSFKEQVEAQ